MSQLPANHDRNRALDFLLSRIDYERALAMPYGQREFQLERMHNLLALLGNPHHHVPVVHVAGTKGKGSTAAMIAAVLATAGYRTGFYTSPHLHRLEERIAINGHPCSATELVALVDRVQPIVEELDTAGAAQNPFEPGPTYFEVITAMAFLHFANQPTDIAVMEVGLGGRLDSTNVCRPLVSVITSISFDHTAQLGNTLAAIAAEKAGIIKPGVPVISGVVDPEPRKVIEQIAAERGSPLLQLDIDFSTHYHPPFDLEHSESATAAAVDFEMLATGRQHSLHDVQLSMLGRHQAANAAVALATLEELRSLGWHLPESAVRRGFLDARCPARVEIIQRHPTIIVDAAHNIASVQSLVQTLAESFGVQRRLLVFATSRDKDIRGMLQLLLPHFDEVILTRYLNNPRAVDAVELEAIVAELSPIPRHVCPDPAAAWKLVRQLATSEHLVCITGSFFLAAEMRREITRGSLSNSCHQPPAARCLP